MDSSPQLQERTDAQRSAASTLLGRKATGRAWAPDALRGALVMIMIVYHGLWNLVYLYGHHFPRFQGLPGLVVQVVGSGLFIALSGFCLSLGRKPLRQGMLLLGAGFAVTLVTGFLNPAHQVHFGILTLLGAGTVVTTLLQRPLRRVPPVPGLLASLGLLLLFWNARSGSLGFGEYIPGMLPDVLFQNQVTAFLGFPPAGFSSGDYFPLLPFLFFFWAGFFLYPLIIDPVNKTRGHIRLRPLCWIGRHSLIIYLLHQPILYGLMVVFLN